MTTDASGKLSDSEVFRYVKGILSLVHKNLSQNQIPEPERQKDYGLALSSSRRILAGLKIFKSPSFSCNMSSIMCYN